MCFESNAFNESRIESIRNKHKIIAPSNYKNKNNLAKKTQNKSTRIALVFMSMS